jgi:sugar phosphate isomerase/epimerase
MFPRPELAVSLAGLERRVDAPWAGGPRAAIQWAAAGFRAVQLDATAVGLRPRELDRSARRDLAALLRRLGLTLTGLDLWIPPEHLLDPGRAERALDAVLQAVDLGADLARLNGHAAAVSLVLPEGLPREVGATITERSLASGVPVADHAIAPVGASIGIDPAAMLLAGQDPAAAAARAGRALASARLSDASPTGRVPALSPGGRLDLTVYLASLAVAGYTRAVVLDLRGLADQGAAAESARRAW